MSVRSVPIVVAVMMVVLTMGLYVSEDIQNEREAEERAVQLKELAKLRDHVARVCAEVEDTNALADDLDANAPHAWFIAQMIRRANQDALELCRSGL